MARAVLELAGIALVLRPQVYPHAPGLDNPQSTRNGMGFQVDEHCSKSAEQSF